jgi:hypothetical protein
MTLSVAPASGVRISSTALWVTTGVSPPVGAPSGGVTF